MGGDHSEWQGDFFQSEVRRKNKFNAKKTTYGGVIYDSKAEAGFAMKLDILRTAVEQSERVVGYERQVPFHIDLNGKKICKYIADFRVQYADGRAVVFDVKGVRTAIYRLKKKLVEAQFGIEIVEITKK